jgi:hypothetical protein
LAWYQHSIGAWKRIPLCDANVIFGERNNGVQVLDVARNADFSGVGIATSGGGTGAIGSVRGAGVLNDIE